MSPSPARTGRRTQAERTAESAARLQTALAELIAEQGYERTTAAQIGERAGYSRAMVRERFGSKDDLLRALHAEYEAVLLADDLAADLSGLDRALYGVDRLLAFSTERPVELRAIFVASFEAVGAARVVRPTVVRWLEVLASSSQDWLRTGQDDGSVSAGLDPAEESARWVDEAVGAGFRWALRPDAVDYPAHLRAWRAALRRRWGA